MEDEETIATGLTMLLESTGMTVHRVAEGLLAEQAVKTFQPDAVVLDMTLPDCLGTDVYKGLSARWKDLPVIFSSGNCTAPFSMASCGTRACGFSRNRTTSRR